MAGRQLVVNEGRRMCCGLTACQCRCHGRAAVQNQEVDLVVKWLSNMGSLGAGYSAATELTANCGADDFDESDMPIVRPVDWQAVRNSQREPVVNAPPAWLDNSPQAVAMLKSYYATFDGPITAADIVFPARLKSVFVDDEDDVLLPAPKFDPAADASPALNRLYGRG